MPSLRRLVLSGIFAALGLTETAWCLDFSSPERLGSAGHNLDLEFDSSGRGHLVYRRARGQQVYYRHFDGTAWGAEVQISDANSPATARKLDVNQPRICLDPEGGAWISWARDRPTNVAYLRRVGADGSPLGSVLFVTLPANVEELHVLARPGEAELHLIALLVEGETREDGSVDRSSAPEGSFPTGTYDVRIDPIASAAVSAAMLTIPGTVPPLQKNLDAALGAAPQFRLHELGRFHRATYGQNDGTGWAMQILHVEIGLSGDLGATQMALETDARIHLASEAFDPQTGLRELQYAVFEPASGSLSQPVDLDSAFLSAYGVPAIELARPDRVLVVWDREEPATVPRLRYAFRDEASGGSFIGPLDVPLSGPDAAGEHPAMGTQGQKVHLVFNDPFDGSLYAMTGDFELPSPPTPTPTPSRTPTATATSTPRPTATPTATPRHIDPGQTLSSPQVVAPGDQELRVEYRLDAAVPDGCSIELWIWMPGAGLFGTLPFAPDLRRLKILDPEPGDWALEVVSGDSCPQAGFYLNHTSAPLAGSPPHSALWAGCTVLSLLVLRRFRRPNRALERQL
jgi:hypothetical protein